MNLFQMHLPVDQAATASSESLALSICFTPDTHGILSGILLEPPCLGHAKAKTPQMRAKLSRRRTGWAAGSKLRRIAGCVASRGGWRLSGSQCSNDYHFSRLHLSSSAVAASSWYSSCQIESEKTWKLMEFPEDITYVFCTLTTWHSSIWFEAMCMNVCHLWHLWHLGRTELHNAVCSGDKNYVQQLLKNRASVDATDGSGPKLRANRIARCCSWEVKFKASMIQSSDSWEGHISTFLCYFLRLSGGTEAGHHYTWPPVSSRNRSKSSNYCWRPEPGLRLKTSAARSLRGLHIEYVKVYDLSPGIQLNSHWRVDSVWELSISVRILTQPCHIDHIDLERFEVSCKLAQFWRLMSNLPLRFHSLEFGLRFEMQGSGGCSAECGSLTGKIWLVIFFCNGHWIWSSLAMRCASRSISIVPSFFILNIFEWCLFSFTWFSSFACRTVSWSTEEMSGMPGWSQDSIACHRMEIQKAPHYNFTGQIRGKREICSKFAPKILWCARDSEPSSVVFRVTAAPRRVYRKLQKGWRKIRSGQRPWRFIRWKNCKLLNRPNQIWWFLCLTCLTASRSEVFVNTFYIFGPSVWAVFFLVPPRVSKAECFHLQKRAMEEAR